MDKTEQEVVTGPVPLPDVQIVFLDQQWSDYEYPDDITRKYPFADEYVMWEHFVVLEELRPEILEQAVHTMLLHHDALRLRLVKQNGKWLQYIVPPGDPIPSVWVDLSSVAREQLQEAVRSTILPELRSLNLAHGPIVKCVYIKQGGEEPGLLFLLLNHVIADGISMQILIEDLLTVLTQLHRGQEVVLPPKSTSLKAWGERVESYLHSKEWEPHLERLIAYKRSWLPPSSKMFPPDYPEEKSDEEPFDKIRVSLSPQETAVLLKQVTKVWKVRLIDILQTALAKTIAPWADLAALPMCFVIHGRDPIFEDIDLSRTIGPFTMGLLEVLEFQENMQPRLSPFADPRLQFAQILLNFSRALEMVYESDGGEKYVSIWDRYNPQITLNFLNFQIQGIANKQTTQTELFRPLSRADLPGVDSWVSGKTLDCFVMLEKGQLRVDWQFGPRYFKYSTIEQLARTHLQELRAFIRPD
jgi:hypothetical protein